MTGVERKNIVDEYRAERGFFEDFDEFVQEKHPDLLCFPEECARIWRWVVYMDCRDILLRMRIRNELNANKAVRANSLAHDGRYAIVHPSAKQKGAFQISIFDQKGPVGDVQRGSIHFIADEFVRRYKQYRFCA